MTFEVFWVIFIEISVLPTNSASLKDHRLFQFTSAYSTYSQLISISRGHSTIRWTHPEVGQAAIAATKTKDYLKSFSEVAQPWPLPLLPTLTRNLNWVDYSYQEGSEKQLGNHYLLLRMDAVHCVHVSGCSVESMYTAATLVLQSHVLVVSSLSSCLYGRVCVIPSCASRG